MIVNNTEFFIEILPELGKELYNESIDVSTNRLTLPIGADYSNWVERDIQIIEENDNSRI